MTDYEKDGEEKIPFLEETEEWAIKCFLAAGVLNDRGDYRKAVSLYQHAYGLRREEAPRKAGRSAKIIIFVDRSVRSKTQSHCSENYHGTTAFSFYKNQG